MADKRSMTVLHEPVVDRHVCGPGWVWAEHRPFDPETMYIPDPPSSWTWRFPYDVPVGRVVECDCGQTWVCVRVPEQVGRRHVVCAYNEWHRETPRDRKRRERRAGKAAREATIRVDAAVAR